MSALSELLSANDLRKPQENTRYNGFNSFFQILTKNSYDILLDKNADFLNYLGAFNPTSRTLTSQRTGHTILLSAPKTSRPLVIFSAPEGRITLSDSHMSISIDERTFTLKIQYSAGDFRIQRTGDNPFRSKDAWFDGHCEKRTETLPEARISGINSSKAKDPSRPFRALFRGMIDHTSNLFEVFRPELIIIEGLHLVP